MKMSKKYYVKRVVSGFDEVEYLDGVQILRGEPCATWTEAVDKALWFDNEALPLSIIDYLEKLPRPEYAIKRVIEYSIVQVEIKIVG